MQSISIPIIIFFIIIYMYKIWSKNPTIILVGAVFFIEMIWQVISIVWLDGGAYISEELRYSYFTGASIRFLILILPFAILYPRFLNKELLKKKNAKLEIVKAKHISDKDLYVVIMLFILY